MEKKTIKKIDDLKVGDIFFDDLKEAIYVVIEKSYTIFHHHRYAKCCRVESSCCNVKVENGIIYTEDLPVEVFHNIKTAEMNRIFGEEDGE